MGFNFAALKTIGDVASFLCSIYLAQPVSKSGAGFLK